MRYGIDEQTWEKLSAKLKNIEAMDVLRELVCYMNHRLGSRIEDMRTSEDSISFVSMGREFLTINITRKGLRIYIHPPAGVLISKDEMFPVERVSIWESSYQKTSGMYRAITVWASKKEHLSGIKALIDRIPISP